MIIDLQSKIFERLWVSYMGGQPVWNQNKLIQELSRIKGKSVSPAFIQCMLQEFERGGYVQLHPNVENYIEIIKPGLMDFLSRLKESIYSRESLEMVFLICFFEFYDRFDYGWSERDLYHLITATERGCNLDDEKIQSALKSLENQGYIRLYKNSDRYVMVSELGRGLAKYDTQGVPIIPLRRDQVKGRLLAAFSRYYGDGMHFWSKKDLGDILARNTSSGDPEATEIRNILYELEAEGHIRLHDTDDRYVEVLFQ